MNKKGDEVYSICSLKAGCSSNINKVIKTILSF